MSFPQINSVDAVLGGQQLFRLLTPLSSAGDLYESESGALAFAMGPDSDLSTVLVNYFDAVNFPSGVGDIVISQDRGYIGRIDARMEAQYIKSPTRKGRILISPLDLYTDTWRPNGFDSPDIWVQIPPQLDVLQYFVNPPSLTPERSDKTFLIEFPPFDAGGLGTTYVAFPTYGRKSGFISVTNHTGAFTIGVGAVRFSLSGVSGEIYGVQGQIAAPVAATQLGTTFPFRASTMGIWDYMYLILDGYDGGQAPITITLSDDVV